MAQQFEEKHYTLEEYLSLQEQSLERYEYFQGHIYLMAGGSLNHSLVSGNVYRLLGNALDERPCRVFNSDLKIQVKAAGLITYPDISVVCGTVEFALKRTDTITNPQLLVEVLSPSTAEYDQNYKFQLYKKLQSLEDYLLVESRMVSVQHYHKLGPNEWLQKVYTDLSQAPVLEKLGVSLPLARIYSKVEFEANPFPLH